MLQDCELGKDVIYSMKRGKVPSIEIVSTIAGYLETSIDYLIGNTEDPAPPRKKLTLDERVAAKYYTLTPDERDQLDEYLEFLKIKKERLTKSTNGQTEISSELQPE